MKKTVMKWLGLFVILLSISVSAIAYNNISSNYNTNDFSEDIRKIHPDLSRIGYFQPRYDGLGGKMSELYIGNAVIEVYEYTDRKSSIKDASMVKAGKNREGKDVILSPTLVDQHYYSKGKMSFSR